MSSFHDVPFPLPLAFGASGGPQRRTEITTLANGYEQRNSAQAHSRRRYDAGVGVKTLADMQSLTAFFEARHGQLYGFRFRDPLDHLSSVFGQDVSGGDQQIGVGDGSTSSFQLIKNYESGGHVYQRIITKPVANTVRLNIDGTDSAAFSVDGLSGVVTLTNVPAAGVVIYAGYEFDVPVRFDTDQLNTTLESFGAGGAVNIPLVEIRD